MPAILIEGGFITNGIERKKILNQRYLNQMAYGICKGIDEYLSM
jgi:N-acetylmuramoyl-L-alanine amidase